MEFSYGAYCLLEFAAVMVLAHVLTFSLFQLLFADDEKEFLENQSVQKFSESLLQVCVQWASRGNPELRHIWSGCTGTCR